jgi:predicted metal-dependent peptidase
MAKDLMSKAKVRLLLRHVFFASLVLSTKIVKDKTCPTAWTDMTQIGYNPDFTDSLDDIDLVVFVLVHEVWHIALKHGLRMKGRNPDRWNRACDYAINWMMKEQGFKIWEHCFISERFAGMSAEAIYEILEKEEQGGGEGQRPTEDGIGGDLRPVPGLDPATRAEIEQQIDQKVGQAAGMARMAGQLTGSLERIIGALLNPPLPWQTLLREFMTQITHDTESWERRNRRFQDTYLPTRHNPRMGELAVIVDTSGSVTNDELAQASEELNEISETVRPERIRVIYADTQVEHEQVFEDGEPVVLEAKGGGGTDMRVPLSHVEQYNPVVCVLITDCYTPWPAEEPSYPLIVAATTNESCPIGHVIRMRP